MRDKLWTSTGKQWTNKEILHEFLWTIVELAYEYGSKSAEELRETAASDSPEELKHRLINIQLGIVNVAFGLIDGRSGPSDWPGIKLVNAETGETLSDDLDVALVTVEHEYLDTDN